MGVNRNTMANQIYFILKSWGCGSVLLVLKRVMEGLYFD